MHDSIFPNEGIRASIGRPVVRVAHDHSVVIDVVGKAIAATEISKFCSALGVPQNSMVKSISLENPTDHIAMFVDSLSNPSEALIPGAEKSSACPLDWPAQPTRVIALPNNDTGIVDVAAD